MEAPLDYLLISPAHPFRGGIADTSHQLALALQKKGFRTAVWTFTKLYPRVLFPGSSPYSSAPPPRGFSITAKIHAYHPLQWFSLVRQLKKNPPKQIIFRYYTPFLAPCYGFIARRLQKWSDCCLLVDNWTPHESRGIDRLLTKYVQSSFTTYATLSAAVAKELTDEGLPKVGSGFHPIAENLPPILPKPKARKALDWPLDKNIALFYGLVRPYKGLGLLIEAMALPPLSQQNTCLAIVGEFYEPLQRYVQQIEQLGLQNRIFLLPEFADDQRTQQVFSAADLVVLPYRTATQSGVVSLAYHFETPLVVTDHPGLKKPVEDDQTGWVCPPEATHLSQTVGTYFDTKTGAEEKNLCTAKKHYTWEQYATWLYQFLDRENLEK